MRDLHFCARIGLVANKRMELTGVKQITIQIHISYALSLHNNIHVMIIDGSFDMIESAESNFVDFLLNRRYPHHRRVSIFH